MMRPKTIVACAAAVGIAAALIAAPADAATKRRYARSFDPVADYNGRPPSARITVRKRSFLDPGPALPPYSQHYHDYAYGNPGLEGPFPKFFDYSSAPGSWSRMPLPGPLDVPYYTRN